MAKNYEIKFLLWMLLFATCNDWLRVPGSIFSLYRIFFPLALLICLFKLRERGRYLIYVLLFVICNIIQNLIFSELSGREIDFLRFGKYLLLYLSVAEIFLIVKVIRRNSELVFKRLLFRFLPILGIVNLIIYCLCHTSLQSMLGLANRNNYAVSLAVIFPYYLLNGIGRKKSYLLCCFAIVVALAFFGSKSALLGIGLEITLILAMKMIRRIRHANHFGLAFLIVVVFVGIAILKSPITIHGYSIATMFFMMKQHIMSGTPINGTLANTSLGFRTNSIIYMIQCLKESCFMGIGIGNVGVYLADMMPHYVQYYISAHPNMHGLEAVSPHQSLLEFFSDCGLWAIILFLFIVKKAIQLFIDKTRNDFMDYYFVTLVLSFPIWVTSASGIYTIYYAFIVFSCIYEWGHLEQRRIIKY